MIEVMTAIALLCGSQHQGSYLKQAVVRKCQIELGKCVHSKRKNMVDPEFGRLLLECLEEQK